MPMAGPAGASLPILLGFGLWVRSAKCGVGLIRLFEDTTAGRYEQVWREKARQNLARPFLAPHLRAAHTLGRCPLGATPSNTDSVRARSAAARKSGIASAGTHRHRQCDERGLPAPRAAPSSAWCYTLQNGG